MRERKVRPEKESEREGYGKGEREREGERADGVRVGLNGCVAFVNAGKINVVNVVGRRDAHARRSVSLEAFSATDFVDQILLNKSKQNSI